MEIRPYILNYIKKQGGSPTPPNLEEKDVTITENTTTIVEASEGYDGLSKVNVTTNVEPNLQSKDVSITENRIEEIEADSGYDGLSKVRVYTNVLPDFSEYFNNSVKAGSSSTSGFARYSLKKIPDNIVIDATQSPYYIMGLFSYLQAITSIPYFDTSGVTSFRYFCSNCSELVDVPIYNTASVIGPYGMNNMFDSCPKLSDDSLNNIMAMCIGAVSYDGQKTLTHLGLSSMQRTKCQTLSNWNDFVAAGWSA